MLGLGIVSQATANDAEAPQLETLLFQAIYRNGTGAEQAMAKVQALARDGNPKAQYILGSYWVSTAPKKARHYLKKSAEGGCIGATALLGAMDMEYRRPSNSLSKHVVKAAKAGDLFSQLIYSFHLLKTGEKIDGLAWLSMIEKTRLAGATRQVLVPGLIMARATAEAQLQPRDKAKVDQRMQALYEQYGAFNDGFCQQALPIMQQTGGRLTVPRGDGTSPSVKLPGPKVKKLSALQKELDQAKQAGQRSVLYFTAGWSVANRRMDKAIAMDAHLIEALKNVRFITVDLTENNPAQRKIMNKYKLLGPPVLMLIGTNGREQKAKRKYGYLTPHDIIAWLDRDQPGQTTPP